MRRTAVAVVVIASIAASLGACNAFSGASGADAPPPSSNDAGTDGGSNGSSLDDAGSAPDVDVDAASTADAECVRLAGGYCSKLSPAPFFCADFDNPTCALPDLFDTIAHAPGATVEVSSQQQPLPGTLHTLQTVIGSPTSVAGLEKTLVLPTLGAGGATIKVSVSVYVKSIPTTGGSDAPRLGPITVDASDSGGPKISFDMETDKSYFVIDENTYSADGLAAAPNIWHTITFSIDQQNAGAKFTGAFDTVELFSAQSLNKQVKTGDKITLFVGATTYKLTRGETWIDNVVVTVQ